MMMRETPLNILVDDDCDVLDIVICSLWKIRCYCCPSAIKKKKR
ncbi:hypothetical protein Hanom_Chr09g00839931 [Helianthus anomalus]